MGIYTAQKNFLLYGIEPTEQKDFDYAVYEPRNSFPLTIPGTSISWTDRKYSSKAHALLSNSIAKTCIAMRATAVSNIDLIIKGNRAVKAVLESPSYSTPTLQSAFNNWETVLAIGGDLFLFYDNRVPGLPQIHSFRPDLVKNDVKNKRYLYDPSGSFGSESKPDFIFYYDDAGKTTLAQQRVGNSYITITGGLQHVCYYDPRTATEGAGAGDSALKAVDIINAIDGMIHRKVKAGGSKSGFFQLVGQPTDAEMEAMKRQLTALNPDGDLNVLPAGMSFNAAQLTFGEMSILETRNQMAKEVCTAFQVPAEMVNESIATYANVRGKDKTFYRNFIGPEAHWLVGQLQSGLRAYVDPAAAISVDETSIQHLEEDRLERATKMAQMKCFTQNEVRRELGFDPLPEGGDEIVGASVNEGQPEEKPKGPVSFNADAGNRGDKNEPK